MSEIKVNSVVNSTGDNDSGLDLATNDNIKFKIANSEKAIIDSNGRLGIKTSSPSALLHLGNADNKGMMITSSTSNAGHLNVFQDQVILSVNRAGADGSFADTGKASSAIKCIATNGDGNITFSTTATNNTDSTQRMMIDKDGNVLVGKTTTAVNTQGIMLGDSGRFFATSDGAESGVFNRKTSDGDVVDFRKDNTTVGSVTAKDGDMTIGTSDTGLRFVDSGNHISPHNVSTNAGRDNAIDLGNSGGRFDDIFATNTSITTSDQNEKQDIASATAKELNVAKKLSTLFKTFRWKDKVAEKGDKARTHTGIVAQEVQSAFKAEGLDASKYGLFTSDTWWEKEIIVDAVKADEEKGIEAKDAYTYIDTKDKKTDGYTERTRLGVRYPELFSFIFSSIEARLTALESK